MTKGPSFADKKPSNLVTVEGIGGEGDRENTVVVGESDILKVKVIDAKTKYPKQGFPVFVKIEGGNAHLIDRGNLEEIQNIDIMDPDSSSGIDEAIICQFLDKQTDTEGCAYFWIKYISEGIANIHITWPDSGLREPGTMDVGLQIFNLEKDALFGRKPIDTSDLLPKPKPVSCQVDAPEDIFINTPNTVTVKAQAGFQPAPGISIELEVLTENAEVIVEQGPNTGNPLMAYHETDKEGVAQFLLSHLPGVPGDVEYIVRWNDFVVDQNDSGKLVAKLRPRTLISDVQGETRRKLGEDVLIAIRVYEPGGNGVLGIPVQISSEEEGVEFYLADPQNKSRETSVPCEYGNTDSDGQIYFRLKYPKEEEGFVHYNVKWFQDTEWHDEGRSVYFEKDNVDKTPHADEKKEEKEMTNTDTRRSQGVPWMKKNRPALIALGGGVTVFCGLIVLAALVYYADLDFKDLVRQSFYNKPPKHNIQSGHATLLSDAETGQVIMDASIATLPAPDEPPMPLEDESFEEMIPEPEPEPLFAALTSDPGSKSSEPPEPEPDLDLTSASTPAPAPALDEAEYRTVVTDAKIVSKNLNIKLADAKKAKELTQEVYDLEKDLGKAEKKVKNLSSSKKGLEEDVARLKKKVNKLRKFATMMENILNHIKVGPVECTGKAEVIWEGDDAKQVNVDSCTVTISVDF